MKVVGEVGPYRWRPSDDCEILVLVLRLITSKDTLSNPSRSNNQDHCNIFATLFWIPRRSHLNIARFAYLQKHKPHLVLVRCPRPKVVKIIMQRPIPLAKLEFVEKDAVVHEIEAVEHVVVSLWAKREGRSAQRTRVD